MRFKVVLRLLGILFIFVSLFMLISLFVSFFYGDGDFSSIFLSTTITFTLGMVLFLGFYTDKGEINHREGFVLVTLALVFLGFAGSLPYLFSGVYTSFIDAYFESVAGFTTTGATVFPTLDGLPHGIVFWRSLTQWLGGMSVILFAVGMLPLLGVGGMQFYRAENPCIKSEKICSRIAETARNLLFIYFLLTFFEAVLLYIGGLSLFDAACHAFATISTGGFSTEDMNIAAYNSPFIQGIIVFFMFLAGINFTLHYLFLKGDAKGYLKSSEFRLYLYIILLFTFLIFTDLFFGFYKDAVASVRHASFETISALSTTGFSSADYRQWPFLSRYLLLVLMIIGGSTGSTAGGLKILRLQLILKQGYIQLYKLIHPHAVLPVKLDNDAVEQDIMDGVWGFFFLYTVIFVVAAIVMTGIGLNIGDAFDAVASTLSNAGHTGSFASLPSAGKVTLILTMLLGRLEIFTVLVVFTRGFWKR